MNYFRQFVISVLISAASTTFAQQGMGPAGNGQQGQMPNERPSIDQLFQDMDIDQNGQLSRSEVRGPLQRDFDRIDTDNNEFLSRFELENAPAPQGQGPAMNGGVFINNNTFMNDNRLMNRGGFRRGGFR